MAFKKGESGNASGRPIGAKDKLNSDLRQWVKNLLDENKQVFENDLKNIDSEKRLNILTTLLKFAIPTLQSVSVETQIQTEYKELEKLLQSAPDEAIEIIINKINSLNNQSDERQ